MWQPGDTLVSHKVPPYVWTVGSWLFDSSRHATRTPDWKLHDLEGYAVTSVVTVIASGFSMEIDDCVTLPRRREIFLGMLNNTGELFVDLDEEWSNPRRES